MVYEIDGKYYVLANHRFNEVKIEKTGNEYDVKLVKNGKILEFRPDIAYSQVSLQEAYKPKKNLID